MHEIGKTLNEYDDNVMADIIKNSGDCTWKVKIEDEEIDIYSKIYADVISDFKNASFSKGICKF